MLHVSARYLLKCSESELPQGLPGAVKRLGVVGAQLEHSIAPLDAFVQLPASQMHQREVEPHLDPLFDDFLRAVPAHVEVVQVRQGLDAAQSSFGVGEWDAVRQAVSQVLAPCATSGWNPLR